VAEADGTATVVVANRDATVCEVLARIVEADGLAAVRVTDPADLGGAVVSAPADAVVLDLGPDAPEHLRSLRAADHPRAAAARVVVISTGPANALLAWQAGADAVLTRPFPAEGLQHAVTSSLRRTDDERQALRDQQIRTLSA
jgi:DNA-binding response OmpR family regulator